MISCHSAKIFLLLFIDVVLDRVQGTVVEVDIARRSFLVDDGTGTIAAIIALPGVADDDDSVDPGDGAHGLPERGAYRRYHTVMRGGIGLRP